MAVCYHHVFHIILHFMGSQLARGRNFLATVALSTLQVFDCTFEKNFFSLSLDYLVGAAMSPARRGLVISASFILPHACTVIVTPFIRKVPYGGSEFKGELIIV